MTTSPPKPTADQDAALAEWAASMPPATANAGIDTVSICWRSETISARLMRAQETCEALGEDTGALKLRPLPGNKLLQRIPVRRGRRGAVIAKVDGVMVMTYRGTDLIAIEGRLHNILGRAPDVHALSLWADLGAIPAAAERLLLRLGLAGDSVPLDEALPRAALHGEIPTPDVMEVRRIDLACDLHFPAASSTGRIILERAAVTSLPRHLMTSYREGAAGTLSLAISRTGTRKIQTRAYDRAVSTGEEPGRTIRIETQHRWSTDRRPTLEDVSKTMQPEAEWRRRVEHWIPLSIDAVGGWGGGAHAVLAARAAGKITDIETEHMLGTVTAIEHGVQLWSADGWRRRKRVMALLGVTPSVRSDQIEPPLQSASLRALVADAWRAA